MEKTGYVYILSNKYDSVFYTGVTSNLVKRIWEHKNGVVPGFTSQYNCHKLVYFEECRGIEHAIFREKQIKSGSRKNKVELVRKLNPEWEDLSPKLGIASLRSQ